MGPRARAACWPSFPAEGTPGVRTFFEAHTRFANGAQATLYSGGAAEPESLRGPQHSHAWCDEIGKWPLSHERATRLLGQSADGVCGSDKTPRITVYPNHRRAPYRWCSGLFATGSIGRRVAIGARRQQNRTAIICQLDSSVRELPTEFAGSQTLPVRIIRGEIVGGTSRAPLWNRQSGWKQARGAGGLNAS